MNCLSWNCRGLGHPRAVGALNQIVRNHNPKLVFLIETKLRSTEWDTIKFKLRRPNGLIVDSRGRRGGLALLWPRDVTVSICSYSSHHIEAIIDEGMGPRWRFVGFYGHHEVAMRKHSWNLLRFLSANSDLPGDFNETLHHKEQLSQRTRPAAQIRHFSEAVAQSELKDMGFKGYPFTWSSNFLSPHTTRARLDRGLCTQSWTDSFPDFELVHLSTNKSDHLPVLLSIQDPSTIPSPKRKRFRFEEQWSLFEGCKETIQQQWNSIEGEEIGEIVIRKIQQTRLGLLKWQRETVGKVPVILAAKQGEYDALTQGVITEESKIQAASISRDIDIYREAHDRFVYKRSGANWMQNGDRCSKLFHSMAKQRYKLNMIVSLQDDLGNLISSKRGLHNIAVRFYTRLFSPDRVGRDLTTVQGSFAKVLTHNHLQILDLPYTAKEVKDSLEDMPSLKALGPDGMTVNFFQKFWDIVGGDVSKLVLNFVNGGELLDKYNFTLLTLIRKVDRLVSMAQFRPISLCNVISKVVAKVLANRIKLVLPDIISDAQSAFVPNRLITDNVVMAYGTHHYIRGKKTGRFGAMSLKLDMEKAYDRVRWDYLRWVMTKLQFPNELIQLIMGFVESVTYAVMLNGEQTGYIKPKRGLRQGDPLSPYLFILVTEGLIAAIREAFTAGRLQGIRIGLSNEPVTSLLFADDSLLFGHASVAEATTLRGILVDYEEQSGQKVNLQKSGIMFSPNVTNSTQQEIQQILQMQIVESHEKYLGLPTVTGTSKAQMFSNIRAKAENKIKHWHSLKLSRAGKEVLLKSVAQAIPSYAMQVFRLPSMLCHQLNGMNAKFWWSNSEEHNSIHWSSWQLLCKPKDEGGLGFRDSNAFNLALLSRQGWRLVTQPELPLSKMLKQKYFPTTRFWEATLGTKPSFTWRSILQAKELVKEGSYWQLGNGRDIIVWGDSWVNHTSTGRVITPASLSHPNLRVSELIDDTSGQWKVGMIEELFYEVDAAEIIQLPLPRAHLPDRLLWKHTAKGDFTVKSAYEVYLKTKGPQLPEDTTINLYRGLFQRLWKLHLPPKVKIFIWRCFHNNLPTTCNLRKKKLLLDSTCKQCNQHEETLTHVLLYCPFAIQVNRILCTPIWNEDVPEMAEILRAVFESQRSDQIRLWCICMWDIWGQRNRILHGKLIKQPLEVVEFAEDYLLRVDRAAEMAMATFPPLN